MVFRDLLFVFKTSYGSKIDEILKILKPDRVELTPVANEKIWQNLFTFWECSTYLY